MLVAINDLLLGDRPMRIAVVGQEYGQAMEMIGLAERYAMIHDAYGLGGFAARTPHLRGTTFALQVLLRGRFDPGASDLVKADGGVPFHIFDAFALVNVLLCSAVVPGTKKGRSTSTMRANCLRHFRATLDVLEPTVVVLQGKGVREWIAPLIQSETTSADALTNSCGTSSQCFLTASALFVVTIVPGTSDARQQRRSFQACARRVGARDSTGGDVQTFG